MTRVAIDHAEWANQVLVCADCGGAYLDWYGVVVVLREEDQDAKQTIIDVHHLHEPAIVESLSAEVTGAGWPGRRRGWLAVLVECQQCGSKRALELIEHKGVMLVEWSVLRSPPSPPTCESPIEELLLAAMKDALASRPDVQLRQQVPLGPYRVDFLLSPRSGPGIVVEADGHDFHDRTREQAERDRRRDRELQRAGFLVLRFTGREIYRDAARCAAEVLSIVGDPT